MGCSSSYKLQRLAAVKPVSVNAELRHIKAAFSFAVDIGMLQSNPAHKVRLCKIVQNNHRMFLDQGEIERLKTACDADPDLRRMVDFTLRTGLRRGEITSLQWRDIDFERKVIKVRNKESFRTKSGKNREVPMNDQVEAILIAMAKQIRDPNDHVFKYSYWWFSKKFDRAVLAAGLPKETTIHTLRHTFKVTLLCRESICGRSKIFSAIQTSL
jgi:integrase